MSTSTATPFSGRPGRKPTRKGIRNAEAGHVTLVGAGPGDPDLLTRKAIVELRGCDAVLYGRLVDRRILRYARRAIQIPVGKKPGRCQETRQNRIHQLMIHYARKGYRIVRLKGGDPFIFGRGGEELRALEEAGISCSVVPGISSFYSVPEVAGIPLTFRGISTAFGVFTGHEADRSSGIDFGAAARMPTSVFLMGVKQLGQISQQLMAHGKDPQTPVAIIRNGTRSNQEVRYSDLSNVSHLEGLSSPSIIVVGEVVYALKDRSSILTEIISTGDASGLPALFGS